MNQRCILLVEIEVFIFILRFSNKKIIHYRIHFGVLFFSYQNVKTKGFVKNIFFVKFRNRITLSFNISHNDCFIKETLILHQKYLLSVEIEEFILILPFSNKKIISYRIHYGDCYFVSKCQNLRFPQIIIFFEILK